MVVLRASADAPHLLMVGASTATAPFDALERLALTADALPATLAALAVAPAVHEVVCLSTCNRVELYATVTDPAAGVATLQAALQHHSGLSGTDLRQLTVALHEEDAVRHLFAVTTGLRSLVIGERQILGQVRRAVAAAATAGTCGQRLHALFREALTVGKRIRRETGISDAAGSVVDAGLDAAAAHLGDLRDRTVLLVGAGKMGGLVASRLRGGTGELLIANRTSEAARHLAARTGGRVSAWAALPAAIAQADLVVCSTGSPHPVVGHDVVEAAAQDRPTRMLVLLDLALPRDVDQRCDELPGVIRLDLDTVREQTTGSGDGDAVRTAEVMVRLDAALFCLRRPRPEVTTAVTALRGRGDAIRRQELDRVERRLSALDTRDRELVEKVTRRIVNRLLHEPSANLGRRPTGCAHGTTEAARVLTELFEL